MVKSNGSLFHVSWQLFIDFIVRDSFWLRNKNKHNVTRLVPANNVYLFIKGMRVLKRLGGFSPTREIARHATCSFFMYFSLSIHYCTDVYTALNLVFYCHYSLRFRLEPHPSVWTKGGINDNLPRRKSDRKLKNWYAFSIDFCLFKECLQIAQVCLCLGLAVYTTSFHELIPWKNLRVFIDFKWRDFPLFMQNYANSRGLSEGKNRKLWTALPKRW